MLTKFTVTNKDGKQISLEELDKEACNLWNRPYDKKYYCAPIIPFENKDNLEGIHLEIAIYDHNSKFMNWFDKINFAIDDLKLEDGKLINIDTIMNQIFTPFTSHGNEITYLTNMFDYLKPYLDLLGSWYKKEYKFYA